mmetsp:Transcript_43535/g.100221  ORF Transcript_43535/g.100221 Transcript_43535/m.100221 type:complete len:686 (-) Transcript_43535:71-2128(-)
MANVRQLLWLFTVLRCAATTNITLTEGSTLCPCAPSEADLPTVADSYSIPSGYGIGCSAHDSSDDSPVAACGTNSTDAPAYCAQSWCYLASSTDCNLSAEVSWSTTYPGLPYSYETCGYLNLHRTYDLGNRLRNSELKVVYLTNSAGWKGVYCTEDSVCSGPLLSYFAELFGEYEVSVVLNATFSEGETVIRSSSPFAPQVSLAYAQAFPDDANSDELNAFDACIVASALGYVDLCISSFTITAQRQQLTNMIPLYWEPVYLVTTTSLATEEEDLMENILAAFKPFSTGLWVLILIVIVVHALLMLLHDYGRGEFENLRCWQLPYMALYKGFDSAFRAGSSFTAKSPGGKMTSLGLGFFVALTLAAYTANRAAQLMAMPEVVYTVNSLDDVASMGASVCTTASLMPTLKQIYNSTDVFVEASSRLDALQRVGSDCTAAALRLEDIETARASFCALVRVGNPLLHIPAGVAASEVAYRQLRYAIAERGEAALQEVMNRARPQDSCSTLVADRTPPGLELEDMFGVFVVTGVFAVLSIIATVLSLLAGIGRPMAGRTSEQTSPRGSQEADDEAEPGITFGGVPPKRPSRDMSSLPSQATVRSGAGGGGGGVDQDVLNETQELVQAIMVLKAARDELQEEVSTLNVRSVNNMWTDGHMHGGVEEGVDRALLQRILSEVQTLKQTVDAQ